MSEFEIIALIEIQKHKIVNNLGILATTTATAAKMFQLESQKRPKKMNNHRRYVFGAIFVSHTTKNLSQGPLIQIEQTNGVEK